MALSQSTPPGELISDGKNRTELQSIIEISISSTNPSPARFSTSNPKLSLTISARQTWSAHPDRPLTLCTRHTPLDVAVPGREWTGESMKRHFMVNKACSALTRRGAMIHHYKTPDEDDWQQKLGFITLPPAASGGSYSVTREVNFTELLGADVSQKVGTIFGLELHPSGLMGTPGIEWWNWGDLEGELKGKNLGYRGDPKLNDKNREEEKKTLGDIVLPFGCWEDTEDDEGNEMVWLEVEFDNQVIDVELVS
ncbi:hypothetical protein PRK78_002594 [Emydomyces testavorans]|uniref:Uncharacterized protein n=1 Tax=Emydomyces testavorans TaxID=2070801 RepID=A0AAF0IJT4_9EURO|nr:hypothetical protein PRK78_002594 [Emydomyces testavorans]